MMLTHLHSVMNLIPVCLALYCTFKPDCLLIVLPLLYMVYGETQGIPLSLSVVLYH